MSGFNIFYDKLIEWGFDAQTAIYLNFAFLLTLALIAASVGGRVARNIIVRLLSNLSARTSSLFDDYLIRHRFPKHISAVIPCVILIVSLPLVFADFPGWMNAARTVLDISLAILFIIIGRSALYAARDYLKTRNEFKDKPVESFIQVIVIFIYVTAGIVIFSLLTGKSPWVFLTAMGAASAVLLLVFKDAILGFVASIQVASNDMVRIGDWISMEKYGADGDVIEINLTTVKVRNWDKTITTIPTYYLISDSFKNWRGMQETGGRRIKRAIYIKISSIRHLSSVDVENLSNISLINGYLQKRSEEIECYNINKAVLINGYNLTNIGVFRQYINDYLAAHPGIHKDMTMMVRQLSPTVSGIPIEIYAFADDIRWAVYEETMSNIFDHLLASVRYFGLEVFEMPAADDVRTLMGHNSATTVKPVG